MLKTTEQVRRKSFTIRLVGAWLSLVEHLVRDQGVGGSNPLAPTTTNKRLTRNILRGAQHTQVLSGAARGRPPCHGAEVKRGTCVGFAT
jgi:hypothetical protein